MKHAKLKKNNVTKNTVARRYLSDIVKRTVTEGIDFEIALRQPYYSGNPVLGIRRVQNKAKACLGNYHRSLDYRARYKY